MTDIMQSGKYTISKAILGNHLFRNLLRLCKNNLKTRKTIPKVEKLT